VRHPDLTKNLAALVRDVQETEARYLLHGDRHDPVTTPWMPYQPADFIGILWECLPELTGNRFIDVGCGPGTKMQIAGSLFGMEVHGIEIDRAMAVEAAKSLAGTGARVECADALAVHPGRWAPYDFIWLYRPFRSAMQESVLEGHIIEGMKPGAILAGGSWETNIPGLGWQTIVDDTLNDPRSDACIWRGAWRKV
jgi:SAM-dependent methyltransferase